jgi:hypothetical protein
MSSDNITLTLSRQSTTGGGAGAGLINCLPHQLQLALPSTLNLLDGWEVALESLSIPRSWFNVRQAYNNNAFSYVWSDGVTYPVSLADGYYTIGDLAQYLQMVMQARGHYLIYTDSTSVQHPQYYLSFVTNLTYYTTTLTATPLPSTMPSNYSQPNGASNTLSGLTPQFIFPAGMAALLGIAAGTYPPLPQSTTYQLNGSSTIAGGPQDPVQLVQIQCSMVNSANIYNTFPSSIMTLPANSTGYGQVIQYSPPTRSYFGVQPQIYSSVVVSLYDQLNRPVPIQDSNILVSLFIRR